MSHRTALSIHPLSNFSCSLVELTARRSALPLRNGIVVHRSVTLTNADIMRRNGWWITTPERSLVDAAGVMEPILVARYAQYWAANKVIRIDRLEGAIARAGKQHGAYLLRRALTGTELLDADSVPEADLGPILVQTDGGSSTCPVANSARILSDSSTK